MELTDEELMMLEQLTYCSKFDGDKGETIGEILRYYDEDRLKKLEMDRIHRVNQHQEVSGQV